MSASTLNQQFVNALDRCAFLLRRISEGDHEALENARDASDEAVALLREVRGRPEWDDEEDDDDDPSGFGHLWRDRGGSG